MPTTPQHSSNGVDLPTRRLGTTDIAITRVGFGAWAIGGTEWSTGGQPLDDGVSVAAIRRALDRGINWIDTAPIYGLGHSEEVVRRALQGMPKGERPYVFTKCGIVWDDRDRKAPPRRAGSPDSLRRELDESLRRLDVERIDLYQMHRPAEDGTPLDGWIGAASLELTDTDLREIAAAIERTGAGQGPNLPAG